MNSIQRLAISFVSIATLACVAGCGTSTKEVDTTTYVPAAPAQVIVQAPPVEVAPPPTMTTNTSIGQAIQLTRAAQGRWKVRVPITANLQP
jgi:hypothetical protein